MKLLREYIRSLLIETAIGQCYPHVVKMAKGSSQEEFSDLTRFKVAHGRITDKFSGESVMHAWVEKGDMIFDWQTHNTKPDGIDRETYYDMFQPEIHDEYTAEETMVNCLKSGQAGPWDLKESVRDMLDDHHAEGNPWEQVFQAIKANRLYGAPEPDINIDFLADVMNKELDYDFDRHAFVPTQYSTFEDWFLRELSDETLDICLKKAALCDMSSPVQGTVRKFVPSGEMTLKKSVIMSEDLLDLLSSDRLIQISLKKTDYHHVHSPVNGQVKEVSGLEKDEFFPGSEAMVIITIGTGFGDVKVVCIGEWSVQTFLSHVEAGDHVDKMTQLGFFYFGSQVIVAFPLCVEIIVNDNAKQRVFPGDPIGICDERVHNI